MVVSTSNLVETFIVRYASRDTLSRSVGQLDRKYIYGGHSAYPMQKLTENVLVSPKYPALKGRRDQGIEWWCQNFNRKFINGRSCACAVKVWLKIVLNAVWLPKFEPVNGISWSPRKIMVKDLRQRSGLAWFCAGAESCVVFNTGTYTVLPDNSILITANMQSETGFPSSHQLKSYVASKSRLKLAARCPVSGCWPYCRY